MPTLISFSAFRSFLTVGLFILLTSNPRDIFTIANLINERFLYEMEDSLQNRDSMRMMQYKKLISLKNVA